MKYLLFEEFTNYDKENDNFLDYNFVAQLFSNYFIKDNSKTLYDDNGLFISKESFDDAIKESINKFSNDIIAFTPLKLENKQDFKDESITTLKFCSTKELAASDGKETSCNYCAKVTISKLNIDVENSLKSYIKNYFNKDQNYYIYVKSTVFLKAEILSI